MPTLAAERNTHPTRSCSKIRFWNSSSRSNLAPHPSLLLAQARIRACWVEDNSMDQRRRYQLLLCSCRIQNNIFHTAISWFCLSSYICHAIANVFRMMTNSRHDVARSCLQMDMTVYSSRFHHDRPPRTLLVYKTFGCSEARMTKNDPV